MKRKRIFAIAVCVVLIGVIIVRLASNYNKLQANSNVSTDLGYVTVQTSDVKSMTISDSLLLTGYTEAIFTIDIAAESQGVITFLDAEPGSMKGIGSKIAVIDDVSETLAYQKALNLKNKLEKDMGRYRNLLAGGSITEQQYDDYLNVYNDAVVSLNQAKNELDNTHINAPKAGIISKKYVEQGEYVNMGTRIATITDITRLKIVINVSESNVYKLKPGDDATITTDVYPGITYRGKVTFVSPQGDDAHNYTVEIEISNDSKKPLKSGTFTSVFIALPETAEALYIPRKALLGSTTNAEVYVAENNRAVRKKILVGTGTNDYLRVISGLKEGDKVITTGQINLSDNKEIRITE
ncbi:Macrolide export protein MacA [bioreactor metagenome]|uniref:Macrolide export protein MacA n=1 Tax=bioreactor metagenome TaxID=1076179 RepID=A0A644YE44_9ZZZZ